MFAVSGPPAAAPEQPSPTVISQQLAPADGTGTTPSASSQPSAAAAPLRPHECSSSAADDALLRAILEDEQEDERDQTDAQPAGEAVRVASHG